MNKVLSRCTKKSLAKTRQGSKLIVLQVTCTLHYSELYKLWK